MQKNYCQITFFLFHKIISKPLEILKPYFMAIEQRNNQYFSVQLTPRPGIVKHTKVFWQLMF